MMVSDTVVMHAANKLASLIFCRGFALKMTSVLSEDQQGKALFQLLLIMRNSNEHCQQCQF